MLYTVNSQIINMVIASLVSGVLLALVMPRLQKVAVFQDAGGGADTVPLVRSSIYPS